MRGPLDRGTLKIPMIVENQNCRPHPHYRAPCVNYCLGSTSPMYV